MIIAAWVHTENKSVDVLIYDKVRWDHDAFETALIEPVRRVLRERGHCFFEIRYGFYREEDYQAALARCRTMIFFCKHETQGIAYQQALSCNVPVLSWDRGGYWQDPSYYPHKVRFQSVSSVPSFGTSVAERSSRVRMNSKALGRTSGRVCWPAASSLATTSWKNLTLEACAQALPKIL